MSETTLELADRALRALGDAGGQATVVRERSLLSRFSRSRPTQATQVDDLTVSLLTFADGHLGTADTNLTTDDGLREAARRARAAAQSAARAAGTPGEHPGLPEPPSGYRAHDGFDPATARLDPDAAGAALATAFAVAAEHGVEAFGAYTAGDVETAIASTAGVRAQDRVTDAYLKVICRDEHGRSGWGAQAEVAAARLDPGAVARRAAGKVPREEPVELAPGEYDAVLDRDAVGGLLDMLGWLAFNGLAHVEGHGALAGKLGTKVAAPCINLSDSPRYRGTWPRAFDAEGTPKAPIPLIQDGVAHRVVHDTRTAARAGDGAVSTGHALSPGGHPEGAVPSNLVLIGGGADDEHELALPIERGIYVTRLWYLNVVHPQRTLLTGTTRDGTYLIEDGRITRPVRDVRFTDEVLRILAATEALSATPRLVSEADHYGRRSATGTVAPALRARSLRITG